MQIANGQNDSKSFYQILEEMKMTKVFRGLLSVIAHKMLSLTCVRKLLTHQLKNDCGKMQTFFSLKF